MSKSAAAALAFVGFILFSIPMSAQFNGLLPNGNVYAGVSYAQLTDVINKQSYRGWNGSFEALPFTRFPRIGLVVDGSGYYRSGVKQYNLQELFLAAARRLHAQSLSQRRSERLPSLYWNCLALLTSSAASLIS